MNRTSALAFASFLMLSVTTLTGQQRRSIEKIDAQLKLWIGNPHLVLERQTPLPANAVAAAPVISVIFKTKETDVRSLVERHGGTLRSVMGSICTADLPLDAITGFAAEPDVVRVESPQPMQLHNDTGRRLIGADKVSSGALPGSMSFTGKGIIVGVVDTGLDFLHPDFRKKDDTTKTRVLSIWDQTASGGIPPSEPGYGSEWTMQQIQTELESSPGIVTQRDSAGHGTHVMGTAGGLRGVAYDADLMMVKTRLVGNGDYTFSNSVKTLDAVNYIYRKARALGRPAVVNLSLGFVFGAPHDGTSLFEQGLDQMTGSGRGFIVCASAGNEGGSFSHHGGYPISDDSVWTYINTLNGATWYGVNEAKYDDSLSIAVSLDSIKASFRGSGAIGQKNMFMTPWLRLKDLKDSVNGVHFTVRYTNGDTAGTIRLVAAAYDEGRTEWYIQARDAFVVKTDSGSHRANLYRVHVKGSGSFHAWTQALNGFAANIAGYGGRTDAHYRGSDNKLGIGIPATARNVLAVGAYVNKVNYTDIRGRTQAGLNGGRAAQGAMAPFSSVGPTLDGRLKPEITAPGLNVASSLSRYADHDSTQMTDPLTAVFSGTSMACPFVTGALALYLEQHPEATFDQVKEAVLTHARHDLYTGSVGTLPNQTWGYGKLDIFAAMGGIETDVAEERTSIDMTGVYPNPATTEVTIAIPADRPWTSIHIVDVTGRTMEERVPGPSVESCRFDVRTWGSGAYFYRLVGNGSVRTGYFIVR
ncbi:MAG: S8 family peptidase ['Candidatus Kapabacteria' thiocyanatum]|uniref:Peptidase S8/S53 domain-containing protein n=1 Tax=Candidatus Kapaibacterium thiocyanatum TaxID=1895771 RepID=A0A1M3L3K0_9BACT|nr:S8 family peptidase ['Candidatus Kapabacteria' thiocyanatum]OJX59934.1 MAG: hypothetical protein BGO89_08010 ['Candidatus Kapabacteria' thiocyanatum]